jgi:hypothetical protein
MIYKTNQVEDEAIKKFASEHEHKANLRKATIKCSHITVSFTETGIGNLVGVHCEICGKSAGVTDHESM